MTMRINPPLLKNFILAVQPRGKRTRNKPFEEGLAMNS